MNLFKKDRHVMSDIIDLNTIINTIYTVVQKTNPNLILDKDKSYNKIKKYIQGVQINEEEGSKWFDIKMEESYKNNLVRKSNEIVSYNINFYIKIIEYFSNILGPKLMAFTKSEQNDYKDELFFSVTRIINDTTPQSSYLGITYRILDNTGNQVLKFKLSPYFNIYTQEYELTLGFTPKNAKDTFCLRLFTESISNLKSYFKCTMLSTMTIKFYKVLNIFFPDGLDEKRKFYDKDIEVLNNWLSEINKEYNAGIEINNKGIIISRNKKFKLSDITKYIPPINTYVFYH